MSNRTPSTNDALAVLVSGGLDSAVLVAEAASAGRVVFPLYVAAGLAWESAELAALARFLDAIASATLRPLAVLRLPMDDVYESHWSLGGLPMPDAATPDEAVYLPGRNVVLLSKALIWCHLRGVGELAMATLAGNPFADATEEFRGEFAAAVNRAIGGSVRVSAPYAALHKGDVIRRGRAFPLELTLSCLAARDGLHCGACNKCAERRKAFADAGVADPTAYA